MLDAILRTHATRRLWAAGLAIVLAGSVGIVSGVRALTTRVLPANTADMTAGPRAAISGPARVIDGDTLEVAGVRVRLEGIDAPESDQQCARRGGGSWRCGQVAVDALERMVRGQSVRCDDRGRDKYGRMLAVCYVGGRDVNAELVRMGLAWAFVRYSATYVAVEAEARAAGIGIWQADTKTAWDHRAERWSVAEAAAPGGCAIKGNITRHGRIYHMPWSPWYDKVRIEPDKGERWFCSEAEAIEAGWRPVQVH